MGETISRTVRDWSQELVGCDEQQLVRALNDILRRLVGWPFCVGTGVIAGIDGKQGGPFSTVIYTSSTPSASEPVSVRADTVACVIDVSETMDLEGLEAAVRRVAAAKSLKKTPPPCTVGMPHTTTTLGIILARDVSVPIEKLAEELDKLNRRYSDREWADMVVVCSKGTVNYAVQFPGEGVLGDYLPPAEGATSSFTAPMYIVLVVRPTGAYTFNKMCGFLLAHLAIFSPGAKLPKWIDVLEGTPKEAMTICGYQYNLSGQLVPVPRQFYNDRYIPPRPVRVEDKKGTLLAALQFLPWQDGGVVLLKGKLPLEGLLVFMGKKGLERGGIVRRGDTQLSYALPITQGDFAEMLNRIQRQSNMIVRTDPTSFVVQKFADEGSSSPFMARLFLGNMGLRDAVFPGETERKAFDKAYEFVIMTLLNARTSAQEVVKMVAEHKRKVADGTIARVRGHNIEIDESINKELRKEVDAFLNSAVRVVKHGMQEATKALQVNIGFLFKKQVAFEKGIKAVEKSDQLLAAYLLETRKWSEPLIVSSRNAAEHDGWMLPQMKYDKGSDGIRAEEPQISGQSVSEFVTFMMDRLSCFVEEVTAHCLQMQLPAGLSITEIPLNQRAPEMPLRFQLTLTNAGMPVWKIGYHQEKFEQS